MPLRTPVTSPQSRPPVIHPNHRIVLREVKARRKAQPIAGYALKRWPYAHGELVATIVPRSRAPSSSRAAGCGTSRDCSEGCRWAEQTLKSPSVD